MQVDATASDASVALGRVVAARPVFSQMLLAEHWGQPHGRFGQFERSESANSRSTAILGCTGDVHTGEVNSLDRWHRDLRPGQRPSRTAHVALAQVAHVVGFERQLEIRKLSWLQSHQAVGVESANPVGYPHSCHPKIVECASRRWHGRIAEAHPSSRLFLDIEFGCHVGSRSPCPSFAGYAARGIPVPEKAGENPAARTILQASAEAHGLAAW